jgi:glycosyltransferase involved in cell wall biosynthesis
MRFTIYSGFYNNVKYLEQVWQGIKNQTYTNWEWIISDDFSDNPSDKEVLKSFADIYPNVKYVEPDYKKEFYFNPPVHHSTGDIMLVQDVDDYPHPKLLEVYNYNFKKFPEVEIISCSSIVRNYNINGQIAWFKDIKYQGLYNIIENYESLFRALGDARAYRIRERNPNEFVLKNEFVNSISEDMMKVFKKETIGKHLFIPRVLHTYVQESENSVCHEKTNIEIGQKRLDELNSYKEKIKSTIDVGELDSIEHYYDEVYDVWSGMLNAEFYKHSENFKVDIIKSNLNPRIRKRIKELYFDYNINFNEVTKDSDYVVFVIDGENDFIYFNEQYKNSLNKKVSITISKDNFYDKVLNLIGMSRPYYWIIFNDKKYINLF